MVNSTSLHYNWINKIIKHRQYIAPRFKPNFKITDYIIKKHFIPKEQNMCISIDNRMPLKLEQFIDFIETDNCCASLIWLYFTDNIDQTIRDSEKLNKLFNTDVIRNEWTALHILSRWSKPISKSLHLLKLCISRCNVDLQDPDGCTPL